MLGFVMPEAQGQVDLLLGDVARALRAKGWPLAGVVQVNEVFDPARPCHMDLHVLQGDAVIRISQNLGALARGCRLDPAGLEQAVGLVEQALDKGPRLLIVNKFGKTEAEGRGFRPVIGRAMAAGLPVLTAVGAANKPAFEAFADGLEEQIDPDLETILAWCQRQTADFEG